MRRQESNQDEANSHLREKNGFGLGSRDCLDALTVAGEMCMFAPSTWSMTLRCARISCTAAPTPPRTSALSPRHQDAAAPPGAGNNAAPGRPPRSTGSQHAHGMAGVTQVLVALIHAFIHQSFSSCSCLLLKHILNF